MEAFIFLSLNLSELLAEESELLRGLEKQAEWTERELRLMQEFLEHFEALEGLSLYENELVQGLRAVATDAEDTVQTLTVKSKQRRRRGHIRRFASSLGYFKDKHIIARKMEKIRLKIEDVHSKIDMYDLANLEGHKVLVLEYKDQQAEASSSTGQGEINVLKNNEASSSAGQGETNFQKNNIDSDVSSMASSLLDKITALLGQGLLFDLGVKTEVITLKETFKSLQFSWDVIKPGEAEGDERWKAWREDVEEIICYADGVIESFSSKRNMRIKNKVLRKAFQSLLLEAERKLGIEIRKIKLKIREVIQRKQDYGVGQIKGKKSSSSKVLDLQWPRRAGKPTLFWPECLQHCFVYFIMGLLCPGVPHHFVSFIMRPLLPEFPRDIDDRVESLSRDLRLIDALLTDVKDATNLDANLSAWVYEMEDIAPDAKAIINSYSDLQNKKMNPLAVQKARKVMAEIDRVKEKIRGATERSIVQRRFKTAFPSQHQGEIAVQSAHVDAARVSTSFSTLIETLHKLVQKNLVNSKLKKKVDAFRRECESFKSFWKEIELLESDERLKAWKEDTWNVVYKANEGIQSFIDKEQQRTTCVRINEELKLAQRIGKIEDKIKEVFHRHKTYEIGEIKGRSSSEVQDQAWQPPANTILNSFIKRVVLFHISCGLGYYSCLTGAPIAMHSTLMHVDDEIESLYGDFRLMKALFKDVEDAEDQDNIARGWVEELRKVAVDVKAVIDKYFEVSKAANMSVKQLRIVSKIAREVDQLKTKICHIRESRILYRLRPRLPSFNINKAVVVGSIDEHADALKRLLLADDKSRRVISITGASGTGKTTLASYIYHDNTIMQKFNLRAWVSVERLAEDSPTAVVKDILEQIMSSPGDRGSITIEENPMQKLRERLSATRYLIVLDNIQTTQLWDSLKDALPEDTANGSGSRIMFASCDPTLASQANFDYPLRLLSDNAGLELFTKTLKMEIPPELQQLGKRILIQCNGLPQAIKTMGNLLSKKDPKKELWSGVLKQLEEGRKPWQRGLDMISKHLPLKLRRCFRYFSIFPADYSIPVRRLIALWVSEDLLRPKTPNEGEIEPPEHVGDKYLMDLIDRNMVRVLKRNLNGKVKTCRLADHLKQFWSPETKGTIFFPEENDMSSSSSSRVHSLADHCDTNDPYTNYIHVNKENSSTSLRHHFKDTLCFLSFDRREGNKPGEDIGGFLKRSIRSRCFQKLRILDLERVFRPTLPQMIGELTGLRYLGLRWTYIETLPSSISNLLKLQILDVKHTYISKLPSSIWNMQQLRHLYLSESYRSRFPARPSGSSLDDLQTLWGVFVDEASPIKNGLDTVVNLKKLGVACRIMLSDADKKPMMESQLQALGAWLGKLKDLESLRLRSYDEKGQPWLLPAKDLSCLEKLSSLYMLGELSDQFDMAKWFPQGLTELTLSASKLKLDHMETLQQNLPCLQKLSLFSNSYTEERMCFNPRSFPQLQVLKIWKLEQLKEWEIKEGALSELRDLEVRSCSNLMELPKKLLHVTSLQILLSNMPSDFTDQYKKGTGKHVCDIKIDD